ncbi:MAG: hypothetical protein M5U01_33885 [Ardenticatenaceae bacterium]|nr:hypothetical protein [Ardenticatenaceae bacterium]HBY92780.1 hypothetical protein [Chloroflexota bacterium]
MANRSVSSRSGLIADESLGVPTEVYPYSAGLVGGLLGGLAMAAVAIATGLLIGRGPWYPLNLVAATIVRSLQATPPEMLSQFYLPALIVGFILHMLLSISIGFLFALLLPTLPGPPWIWSLLIGPALWFGAQFVVLPAVNPVMSTSVWLPSFFVAHLVYGLVLGAWVQRGGKVPVS